jgi:hypothetical protein
MAYREPAQPPARPESPELDDYERKLLRSARRKKILVSAVITTMAVLGLGTCLAPCATEIVGSAWRERTTKLTDAEAKQVRELLDPIEANTKKSPPAFDAIWRQLRAGELGPRRDLGACDAYVPGPHIKTKDDSTSLEDSSQGVGWTFIDLTPASARSPLASLPMPQGSMALNNAGTERHVFAAKPLRTAPGDKAPTLDSTTTGLDVAKWRAEAAAGIRHDDHAAFLERVKSFAGGALLVDVVVFVDLWENPKFSDAPPPKDETEDFNRPSLPTRAFEGGFAIGRAFAWDPEKQRLVCASQALARNSPNITFRSRDLAPLQQDLVLQLERGLQRSFVAVGAAPPRLERPPPVAPEPSDAGSPDAGPPKRPRR